MARNKQKCIPWRIFTSGMIKITSTNLRIRFCGSPSSLWVIQCHEKQTPSRIRFALNNPKLDHLKFDYGVPVHLLVCDINATSQISETFFDFLLNWIHRSVMGNRLFLSWRFHSEVVRIVGLWFLLCCHVDWIAIKPTLVMRYLLSDVFCIGF